MEGPGEYLPDVTEGITRVEDLPKPRIVKQSRNFKHRPCPSCDRIAPTGPIDLGPFDLREGENRLMVEIVGINEAAIKNYMFGLDYILLR